MHIPVLLNEIIEGLAITSGDVCLDGTVGSGGHSLAFCRIVGQSGLVIGLDKDPVMIAEAQKRLTGSECKFRIENINFRNLDEVSTQGVDRILFDLGLNSLHLEESGLGFSFKKDEPLMMTFEKDGLTAKEILNEWDEKNLEIIIDSYGEERYSKKIARGIVEYRENQPIETTSQLVEIIKKSVPSSYLNRRIHPATKTFQALRITVNDELGALKEGLEKAFQILKPKGRLAIISFHSLEDRIVKRFFREKVKESEAVLINKKPITATEEEIKENPRSRSAKLRILEKNE